MTFWTSEKSVQDSQPIELVDFACGSTHWRQCSGVIAITYSGQSYTPQPGLKVGATEDNGNVLRSACQIAAEWGNPFVKLFPGTPPDAVVTVDVYRTQGANVSPWWSGYVADVQRQENRRATIACVASFSLLGVGSLCLRCGRQCQVPLYSSLCGVTQAAYEANGNLTAVSGTTLSAAVFATEADGYWEGGPLTVNGYDRMVLDHSTDTVEISEAVPGAAIGQAVTVAPGCDHKPATCETKFSNLLNFKGFPNLPQGKNAFTQGVY